MLLIQASEANSEPSQAHIRFKFWWKLLTVQNLSLSSYDWGLYEGIKVLYVGTLTSDPTDLKTKKFLFV